MVCAAVLVSNVAFFAESDLAGAKIRVEQGKILDFSAEPGYYTFDIGGEPSLFAGGSFKENAVASLRSAWDRFKFGGSLGKDTRVYYFNLKELVGNKYGTPNPVPFRVVDSNIGLDIDISIRCFGEYSYHISNPILFYTNVTGNVAEDYKREDLDSQLKSELMTALQPAFAKISAMGIRYSALPGHTAWICPKCSHGANTGKFCSECGEPRPADGWSCSCGHTNKGKFCSECGKPKPPGTPQFKCDKCGWEPEDPLSPPKFCPECGDRFDEEDQV